MMSNAHTIDLDGCDAQAGQHGDGLEELECHLRVAPQVNLQENQIEDKQGERPQAGNVSFKKNN